MSNDSDCDAYFDNSSDGFAATLSTEEEMSHSEIVSQSESENSWSPVYEKKPARFSVAEFCLCFCYKTIVH